MTLYTSLNEWIPQPGRITRSWPSGLVLLQQEFVGQLATLGDIALPGDPFPADDAGTGAKVYGMPEYRDLGNGLQSATVSSYGIAPGATQKIEEIATVGGIINITGSYYNEFGELRPIDAAIPTIVVYQTEVKTGVGVISAISASSETTNLKTYSRFSIYGASANQDLEGYTFRASNIVPGINSDATVTFTNNIIIYPSSFTFYGDVWEARARISPNIFPTLNLGIINDPPA